MSEARTSVCLDCKTPMIGDRPRCPACHTRHGRKESLGQILLSWVVVAEILLMLACGLVLAVKGCS